MTIKETTKRTLGIPQEDFYRIREAICVEDDSKPSTLGLQLVDQFGPRAREITMLQSEDVNFEENIISITSMGGKTRKIAMNEGQAFWLKLEIAHHGIAPDQRIVPLSPDTLRHRLNRILRDEYQGAFPYRAHEVIHALRHQE